MARPYLQFSSQDLEELANECWGSAADLQQILEELRHRSTPKSQRLERKVAGRLADFGVAPQERNPCAGASTGASELAALRERVLHAEQQIREREAELARMKAELNQARAGNTSNPTADLYAKVGLHPSCPDFLVQACQRVWRKEYHPDALSDRPDAERRKAEEVFKEVENVFARIQTLRQ